MLYLEIGALMESGIDLMELRDVIITIANWMKDSSEETETIAKEIGFRMAKVDWVIGFSI